MNCILFQLVASIVLIFTLVQVNGQRVTSPVDESSSLDGNISANSAPSSNVESSSSSNINDVSRVLELIKNNNPSSSNVGTSNDGEDFEDKLIQRLPSSIGTDFSCHLRTVDLCAAGIMARAQAPLPANDMQLNVLCEDIKTAMDCAAAYNERCQTLQIFGGAGLAISTLDSVNTQTPFCYDLDDTDNERLNRTKLARSVLLRMAPCVNERFTHIRPCINDLQAALVIIYQPGRSYPPQQLCCAYYRFRKCATNSMDDFCGLGAFNQLESMLSSIVPTRAMEFACKRFTAPIKKKVSYDDALSDDTNIQSKDSHKIEPNIGEKVCSELLPPPGTPIPRKRGKNTSKLARILAMFSAQ